MHRARMLLVLGAVGLAAGALLPWITIRSAALGLSMSRAGHEGDGFLTGLVGVLLFIIAAVSGGKPGRRYSLISSALAGASILVLLLSMSSVRSVAALVGEGVTASAGPGIFVSLVGALACFAGGLGKVPVSLPSKEAPSSPV